MERAGGFMSYPEQSHGEFTCENCLTRFQKGTPTHGDSGYCTQCEIALGMLAIHHTPEENLNEQRQTARMIANYVGFMRK